jgi:hypothetical protein
LAAAAAIRAVGDRPSPPALRDEVDRAWLAVADPVGGSGVVLLPRQAADLARQALTGALTAR